MCINLVLFIKGSAEGSGAKLYTNIFRQADCELVLGVPSSTEQNLIHSLVRREQGVMKNSKDNLTAGGKELYIDQTRHREELIFKCSLW